MSAPRNDQIQTALITKIKSLTAVMAELVSGGSSSSEVREDQWQGDEFDYPNIRVRMISNTPDGDTAECSTSGFSASLMVFSQGYSSLESDKIAGIMSASLNGKTFSENSLQIFVRTINIIPAIRSDMRTWRAECLVLGQAAS